MEWLIVGGAILIIYGIVFFVLYCMFGVSKHEEGLMDGFLRREI